MGWKLPLLTPREVRANLRALGFVHKRTCGSHEQWVRQATVTHAWARVTVDVGPTQYSKRLMKMMIRESLLSAEEFCSGVMKPKVATSRPAVEGDKNA
jgi:predicted RNA binding protein YcfA (HicA-like mRNA interferase family)